MKKISFYIFLLVYSLNSFSQVNISGFVKDLETNENIIGATIVETNANICTSTNDFGFFSIPNINNNDTVKLIISYLGYIQFSENILINSDTVIQVFLSKSTQQIGEIVVNFPKQSLLSNSIGTISIPIEQIKLLPSLGGENDILKAFQLMPGVQQGSEGNSNLYVRGGSPDQNLLILDDIPLYYVGHVGGLFSVFNPNSLEKVELYKSGFPLKYGGRLSSVINIRQKEGNKQKINTYINFSLIISKFLIEGPIKKGKSSFFVSARRSNIDLFQFYYYKLINKNESINTYYSFYDLNSKLSFELNKKNKLIFNFYSGSDKISISEKETIEQSIEYSENSKANTQWGNILFSIRLNSIISNKFFQNTSIAYTKYNYKIESEYKLQQINNNLLIQHNTKKQESGINDFILKSNWEYKIYNSNQINFGIDNSFHIFNPEISSIILNGKEIIHNQSINSVTSSLYLENFLKIKKKISINYGLRYNFFAIQDTTFCRLIPRLSINYNFLKKASIKFAYDQTTQFVHLLTNNTSGLPTDLWVPATKKALPENTTQYSLEFIVVSNHFSFTTDIYYKSSNNLIEHKDGTYFFGNSSNWENNIEINGIGLSKGIEFLVKKNNGKLTGWISYTLAKTTRQFSNLNNGKPYYFKYDRTNNLSIVANIKIKNNLTFSATWRYMTGNALTLATTTYNSILNDKYYGSYLMTETSYVEDKNSFRMPDYHRLDVSLKYIKKNRTISFDIYNLYSRSNAYFLYADYPKDDFLHEGKKNFYILTLFPIIPSISYSIKF